MADTRKPEKFVGGKNQKRDNLVTAHWLIFGISLKAKRKIFTEKKRKIRSNDFKEFLGRDYLILRRDGYPLSLVFFLFLAQKGSSLSM